MQGISLLPLLQIQRELYEIPRGPARFRRYLDVMIGDTNDILLPLSLFNPMGKESGSQALDALIALDAERIATQAIEEAGQELIKIETEFEVCLLLADDKGGGWTNRHYVDINNRFRPGPTLKRRWAITLFWTSEIPTHDSIRQQVLATIYRTLFILKHGPRVTLRQMMAQEGLAAIFGGETESGLDRDELEYTREVIRPHLDATDLTVILPALYGDRAAKAVGNDPMGLSDGAGLALALAEALANGVAPSQALQTGAVVA